MSSYWQAEQRFDWRAYAKEQGAVPAMRYDRAEYVMECPDCSKPKLAINVKKRKWRCFVCGDAGHEASSLIVKVQQCFWKEAIQFVLTGQQLPIGAIDKIEFKTEQEIKRPAVFREMPWPDGFEPYGRGTRDSRIDWGHVGVAYCRERGIHDHVAIEMKLGTCRTGRFGGRLLFPVFDSGNRLIFYQGRAMWQPKPFERHIKTLSPRWQEGYAGASDVLLNLQYLVQHGQVRRVLVVEGPIDCAHAWPDAVASFGKNLSPKQMELLIRAGVREIDLCWDQDPPKKSPDGKLIPGGAESMLKTAPLLADLFTVRIVQLPIGTDPGDLTKDQIEEYRDRAVVWGSGGEIANLNFEL